MPATPVISVSGKPFSRRAPSAFAIAASFMGNQQMIVKERGFEVEFAFRVDLFESEFGSPQSPLPKITVISFGIHPRFVLMRYAMLTRVPGPFCTRAAAKSSVERILLASTS